MKKLKQSLVFTKLARPFNFVSKKIKKAFDNIKRKILLNKKISNLSHSRYVFYKEIKALIEKDDEKGFAEFLDRQILYIDGTNQEDSDTYYNQLSFLLYKEIINADAIKCFLKCSKILPYINAKGHLNLSFLVGDHFLLKLKSLSSKEVLSLLKDNSNEDGLCFPSVLEPLERSVGGGGYTVGKNRNQSRYHQVLLEKIFELDASKDLTLSKSWIKNLSLPFDKTGEILFKYLQKTKDFEGTVIYLNHLTNTHPYKAQEIFEVFYEKLHALYPQSFLIKEIRDKKLLPLWGTFTEEKISAKTLKECYPNLTNRLLLKQIYPRLFITKELFYRGSAHSAFKRVFFLEKLWDLMNKVLEDKNIEPQWFLKLSLENEPKLLHLLERRGDWYNNLLDICTKFKDKSIKMKKSLIYHFCEDPQYGYISDTLAMIKKHNVDVNEFGFSLESFPKYHDFLFQSFEDDSSVELNQVELSVLDAKNTTISALSKEYKIKIPYIARELGQCGKFLNICVGNGIYKDKVLAKRSFIFFLELDKKITHCIEVEPLKGNNEFNFSLLQASGVKNEKMPAALKKEMCSILKIKENYI